jgi:adenosine kinase
MDIIVSGSLAFDRIMTFPGKFQDHILPDKLHILNVCFTVDGLEERFGGTAGNIAYNLAMLGEKPLIVATAGRDFGPYREWLLKQGLSVKGIRTVDDEATAGAYITTDQSDNQITGFNPGAMKHSCMYDFNGFDPGDTLAIIAPGNLDDMKGFAKRFKELKIKYICDPGQQLNVLSPEDLEEMAKGAHILISNDYELEMIMNSTGLSKEQLLDHSDAIVTTLGEKGALVSFKDSDAQIGAAKAQRVLDPTGAGDSFRAGLIKGLAMGKDIVEAAKLGAVISSFSVECQGTQCHMITEEQFWERHKSAFPTAG